MEDNKIKIAHVVLNLDIGGLETMVVDLVKGLDRERFDVVVVCLRGKGALAGQIEGLGFKVYGLGGKDCWELSVLFRLAGVFRRNKVDVVHCHNTAGYFYGGIAAILAGIKRIVYTEHGRVFPDTLRRMITERILSFFTEKIVAVSEDMKRCLVKYEKINPSKIQVIHNGVDTEKFRPLGPDARCKMRDALGIGENDIVIGNVARLDLVKDHQTLIRAFALIKRKIDEGEWKGEKEVKLLIVGDGPEMENIQRIIDDFGLVSCVLCLGVRSDIPELMNIMDVFVLSSINEGTSLTLLEAMACGVPVVATNVGGNPEIVIDGENGLLCEPGHPQALADTILKVLNSPVTRHSSPVTLRSMISQYEEVYVSR